MMTTYKICKILHYDDWHYIDAKEAWCPTCKVNRDWKK